MIYKKYTLRYNYKMPLFANTSKELYFQNSSENKDPEYIYLVSYKDNVVNCANIEAKVREFANKAKGHIIEHLCYQQAGTRTLVCEFATKRGQKQFYAAFKNIQKDHEGWMIESLKTDSDNLFIQSINKYYDLSFLDTINDEYGLLTESSLL